MPTVEELLKARADRRFTATEQRIVNLLADGIAHSVKELLGLLDDELASNEAVKVHISRIRGKLPRHVGIYYDRSDGCARYRMVLYIGGAGE